MLLLPVFSVLLCVVSVSSPESQTCEDALKTCSVIACGRDGRDGPKGEKGEPGTEPRILAFYTFTSVGDGSEFRDDAQGPGVARLSLRHVPPLITISQQYHCLPINSV